MVNDCIIIGGGSSIRPNRIIPIEELDVWKKIKHSFTIGTNFTYKWFIPTVQMFGDHQFYYALQNELSQLPLVIGNKDRKFYKAGNKRVSPNTHLIIGSRIYNGIDSIRKGLYCYQLIGMAAISFAIGLQCKNIYLLGYDCCAINGHTHFYSMEEGSYTYNNIKRTGIGQFFNERLKKIVYRSQPYDDIDRLNNYWFAPFKQALNEGINIFNVSEQSVLNVFPKINYDEFYKKIALINHQQNEIRQFIKERL